MLMYTHREHLVPKLMCTAVMRIIYLLSSQTARYSVLPAGNAKESSLNNDRNNPARAPRSAEAASCLAFMLPMSFQCRRTCLRRFGNIHGKRKARNIVPVNFFIPSEIKFVRQCFIFNRQLFGSPDILANQPTSLMNLYWEERRIYALDFIFSIYANIRGSTITNLVFIDQVCTYPHRYCVHVHTYPTFIVPEKCRKSLSSRYT